MDAELPLRVEAHTELQRELVALRGSDPGEEAAATQAHAALAALGRDPGYPLTSAVRGPLGRGLRELRPRAGRSRHRILFARQRDALVLLALAPEAQRDPRGFDRALRVARTRLASLATQGGTP